MYLGGTAQARLSDAIGEVSVGVASAFGDDYFRALVAHVAKVVGVDHAFVAEPASNHAQLMRMVAESSTELGPAVREFAAHGSACELTLDQGCYTLTARVSEEFPSDPLMRALAAESFCGKALRDSNGNNIGVLCVAHGATLPSPAFVESLVAHFAARTAAELERRGRERLDGKDQRRLRAALECAPLCVHELSPDGRVLSVNREGLRITGRDSADELPGSAFVEIVAPWERGRLLEFLAQAARGQACRFEYTALVQGEPRVLDANLVPVTDDGEVVGRLLVYSQDVTDRKRSEERLVHLAKHDSLTNLPNRGLFMDRLQSGIARAKRNDQALALLFVDLNNFKPVNDVYGHQMGDRLLRVVAQRLVAAVREVDTVARIGGDEFAIILEAISGVDDASSVAAKIADTVGEPFSIEGQYIQIGASTGIALYPADGIEPTTLLQHADSEMYRVKRESAEYRGG